MRTITAFSILSLIVILLAPLEAAAQRKADPGAFDYYILSLSWSPAHCSRPDRDDDPDQCGAGKNHGFVVHGLWPQHEQGGYPRSCSAQRTVPKAVVDETMPVMPSPSLMVQQWQKHGTCSGVDVVKYFATLRDAAARVTVPDAVKTPKPDLSLPPEKLQSLFTEANPGLTPDMVAVICARRQVTEVRVCLDKDLKFRACGKGVADRCGKGMALKG
ncbi:ribonuclease T2 [Azospirillum sp.]|uniref:ribonuclease T2 n=1 Tax=Azospirillum sp. TaxID=34012 RepID=UPI002D49B897|nr:ribonuclease T2 [Azospirillum sp.]HYD65951.1 ribonuclease T2 [Azospirillum sp.]